MMPELEESHSPAPNRGRRRGRSVLVYLAVLFVVAFLLLLLAFFMQQRTNAASGGAPQGLREGVPTQEVNTADA